MRFFLPAADRAVRFKRMGSVGANSAYTRDLCGREYAIGDSNVESQEWVTTSFRGRGRESRRRALTDEGNLL